MHVFESDFHQERKNVARTLFEGPNRTKNGNRKNAEIFAHSVKSGLFWHSKRQNSAVFRDSNLKFCTHIHHQEFLYLHIFRIFDTSKILEDFEKPKFLMIIFPFLIKKIKVRDNILIAMFNLYAFLTNLFYL